MTGEAAASSSFRAAFASLSVDALDWNQFETVATLPKGGQSVEVLKLRNKRTKQFVVGKVIALGSADAQRFHREVEMLHQFGSVPQIVPFLGVCFLPDRRGAVAIVTEFAEGGSLDEALKARELTGAQLSSILMDVLLGLKALHAAGVIHRDIKPSNVLLNKTKDHAWLCDFGSSRLDSPETQTIIITQGYAAEEAVCGRASTASDIFSFGVLLRQAVARKVPTAAHPAYLAVINGKFDLGGVANRDVARLISDCVQRDPSGRPHVERVISRLGVIGVKLLEGSGEATRKIRFRDGDDEAICSFVAKDSQTVEQALAEERLKGRLWLDGRAISLEKCVDGLDPGRIYVLRS